MGGKTAFPVTSDGLVSFNVKGRCKIDEECKEIKHFEAAEFVWNVFDFKKDQDLRLKIGYDVLDKFPNGHNNLIRNGLHHRNRSYHQHPMGSTDRRDPRTLGKG
ncbi:hypothetical protein OROGR_033061 [Orobanche gracilis]